MPTIERIWKLKPVASPRLIAKPTPVSSIEIDAIDALRLRTSEMGCSRCMALGSTSQGAYPR